MFPYFPYQLFVVETHQVFCPFFLCGFRFISKFCLSIVDCFHSPATPIFCLIYFMCFLFVLILLIVFSHQHRITTPVFLSSFFRCFFFNIVSTLLIVCTHQHRIATPWPSPSSSHCCFCVLALTALCLWNCL